MEATLAQTNASLPSALDRVSPQLFDFLENQVLPHTDLVPAQFWSGFVALVDELSPENQRLLNTRDHLQSQIDGWLGEQEQAPSPEAYRSFLQEIGYLQPEINPEPISTENVDPEIATMAGHS
jgi:malate synthase